MTKNIAFHAALNDPNLGTKREAVAALSELLTAGAGNVNAFRQAILAKSATVWDGLGAHPHTFLRGGDNDDDGFLLADGGANPGAPDARYNFIALTKLAAKKRVLLTLKEASIAQLEDMLNPAHTNDEVRRKLFGNDGRSVFGPPLTIPGWNPTTQDIIEDAAVPEIREEARRQLLIKKIATSNDQVELNNLLGSAGNDRAFQTAARAICGVAAGPRHFTDDMGHADLAGAVMQAAAKRVVSLEIDAIPDDGTVLRMYGLLIGGGANVAAFKAGFSAAAAQLTDSDAAELQGNLGTRFLMAAYSSLDIRRINDLEAVAKSVSAVALQGTIAGLAEAGPYVNQAVTDSTYTAIRQAAAKQALRLKIIQCEDETALNELISVRDNNELKQKLANQNTLGYNGALDAPFREAFIDPDVNDIVALAHIRKNLSIAPKEADKRDTHLAVLKLLITNPAQFSVNYINHLASTQTPAIQGTLRNYFADPVNVNEARAQALITYLQQKLMLLKDNDTNLTALINANNALQVIPPVKALLGIPPGDNSFDVLIGHVEVQIRDQAQVEKVIRKAKQPVDLTGGKHATLLQKINTGSGHALDHLIANLPEREKQRVKISLVESLIRNLPEARIPPAPGPNTDDGLKTLAKATDIEQFKAALRGLGVNDESWVNRETMEQIQRAACTQIIKLDQNKHLPFGNGDNKIHPKLIKLIDELPLAQQRALLEKPSALVSLSQVTELQEIHRILGGKVVDDSFANELVKENERLTKLARISNSEIAKILAKLEPPLDLDQLDRQIILINNHLTTPGISFDEAGGPPGPYAQRVDQIARIIGRLDQATFNAFGLDNTGQNIVNGRTEDAVREAIRGQHTNNQHVLTLYTGASAKGKAIYGAIAGLSKLYNPPHTAPLSQQAATDLYDAIRKADTYIDFKKAIAKPPVNAHLAAFDPPLIKQITPQRFSQIKVSARLQGLSYRNTFQKELKGLDKTIDALETQFSALKLDSISPLKRLAAAKPIYWFNPAFQAAAKENAKKMGSQFRELSDNCNTMVTHLRDQHRQIQEQLNSLPRTRINPQTTAELEIIERRTKLLELRNAIKKELEEYEKLQLLFKGDPSAKHPLLKQGVLTTLKQAEEGKHDIRVKGFHSYAVDYPIDQKPAHFAAAWQSEGVRPADQNGVSIKTGVPAERFEITDMVGPGKFREYTVYYDTVDRNNQPAVIKSTYIEERGAGNLAGQVGTGGVTQYSPELTLTANKFPPRNNPEARVHQAMEMATRILAARGKPPTIDDPIILDGPKDQIEFAWTALMAIGKNDPNMRFDASAIVVDNAQFSPDSQLGILGRWKGDSIFKKHFETHPSYTGLLAGIKEIDKLKFGKQEQKAMETARKDTAELTQFYKNKNRETVLGDVKQKNVEIDDTIPPPTAPAA